MPKTDSKTRGMTTAKIKHAPHNLASLIRGLYGRVARRFKVDPSYVSRIARGERHSDAIEGELRRELDRITKQFSKKRQAKRPQPGKSQKAKRPL